MAFTRPRRASRPMAGGHARGAPFRALGFALTFYPTVGLHLFLLPAAVRLAFS